jgi:hypothetical protein
MDTDTTARKFAVLARDQRNHQRGVPQIPAGNGHGQPIIRSLLQAAGMAPIADESLAEESPFGISVRGLPLIELRDGNAEGARYCVATTVDYRGRFADRTPLKIMGWEPATSITISMIPNAGIILVRRGGADAVTRQGHLRLPPNIRHGCRIRTGDRVLVVAHLDDGVLVGYTPFAMDAMASAYHASIATLDIR